MNGEVWGRHLGSRIYLAPVISGREESLGEVKKLQALVKEYFSKRIDIIQQVPSGDGLENMVSFLAKPSFITWKQTNWVIQMRIMKPCCNNLSCVIILCHADMQMICGSQEIVFLINEKKTGQILPSAAKPTSTVKSSKVLEWHMI